MKSSLLISNLVKESEQSKVPSVLLHCGGPGFSIFNCLFFRGHISISMFTSGKHKRAEWAALEGIRVPQCLSGHLFMCQEEESHLF